MLLFSDWHSSTISCPNMLTECIFCTMRKSFQQVTLLQVYVAHYHSFILLQLYSFKNSLLMSLLILVLWHFMYLTFYRTMCETAAWYLIRESFVIFWLVLCTMLFAGFAGNVYKPACLPSMKHPKVDIAARYLARVWVRHNKQAWLKCDMVNLFCDDSSIIMKLRFKNHYSH